MVIDIFPLNTRGAMVRRRGKTLVGPVDLTLESDEFTIVIGPNGSGKTSLLKMLHGILRLNSGEVEWACATEDAQKLQAFVFQTPVMLRRTVLDNLIYPLRLSKVPKIEARMLAMDWVESIGLVEAQMRPATVLSGGERQKLAIARALIRKPALLFLDEPCASLDGRAMREIETILKDASENGTRIVMSTHDMGQARRLASEVIFMLNGQVHEFGHAGRFFDQPQTQQARSFLKGDIVD